MSASVHQKLLNKARTSGRPFNELLQYFTMERFLYRLGLSPHRDRFILKGALMFVAWGTPEARATRDIDLLGRVENQEEAVAALLKDVCRETVEDDGLSFDPKTVQAERIMDESEYVGVRVKLYGKLGNARIPMQVDVGFGDSVVPAPKEVLYPVLLDFSAPRLKGYPKETAIAEKFHAMVDRGLLNSRMKDFYDVAFLAARFDFDAPTLARAIKETFSRRGTSLSEASVLFSAAFAGDAGKSVQWIAFIRKNKLKDAPPEFPDVMKRIGAFLEPIVRASLK